MSGWIRVTTESELADGGVRAVKLSPDHRGIPREALVLVDEAGRPRAYLNRCRHIPIPIDGGSKEYLDRSGNFLHCGTHGALYRKQDGFCFQGPCRGLALVRLELERRGDTLWVEDPT